MNLEIGDEEDGVLDVKLEDANEAVANTLRRAMMIDVPTLAVEHLEVQSNESGLFDEMLAHRIGQVPLTVPDNVEEDDTVHIAIKQDGPGTVLAEDIKTDNDESEPVNPETVIVELKENQSLELEGEAVLGKGKEHAKHQGGTVGYDKTGDGEFVFRIESTSGHSNRELLRNAVGRVKQELDDFEDAVEEL